MSMLLMPQRPEDDLQQLLAEEPFVRALAQHLVIDDADEVVQQTYLLALQHGGKGVHEPRNWLARIVRNVAANLRRGDRRRLGRQRAVAMQDLVPSSAELAEREERRRALVAAVDALPPSLRTVVLLRWFDGMPPRRIAAALGVPSATVSNQLHRALELLRQRLDAAHGGNRRAWLLPLVPFVVRPTPPPLPPWPALPALLVGTIAMTTKTKLVTTAAVLLLLAGAWALWPQDGVPNATPEAAADRTVPAAAQSPLDDPLPATSPEAAAAQREAVTPTTATATRGTLIVHLRYGDDHTPAAGRVVTLEQPGSDPRFDGRRQRTDELGTARYEEVQPGRLYVSESNSPGKSVEVAAGEITELDLDLEIGMAVTGIAVDDAHVPVAGAQVEITMMARSDSFPDVVAVTGADGRFTSRANPIWVLVGARAAGYTASSVQFVLGKEGNTAEVELVLGRDGGSVDGVVVDATGKPIASAVVILGAGKLSGIGGQDHLPPFPALARSDDEGHFHAVGIPAGEQPVQARAPGFAPWQGTCEVTAGLTVPLRVTLDVGAVIRGSVRNAQGQAIDRAEVEIGRWDDLAHFRSRTAADGTFELTGLPIGELNLRARHDDHGKAEQLVRTVADTETTCDFQLSRGFELKGHVVDPDGQPVPEVFLECMSEQARPNGWFEFARTDSQGRFSAANCPETDTISISIRAKGFEELRKFGIDPKAGVVELQLQRIAPSSVRFVGTVVGPDGRPVANASVSVHRQGGGGGALEATGNDGRFEIGPYPPGGWKVSVRSREHPEFVSELRELAADATWDLGMVTLTIGGTAVVHQLGVIEGVRFYATSVVQNRSWPVTEDAGQLRSSVMAPGDYHLVVSGKGVAAQAVPFTILAGEEITVSVQPQTGTSQHFTCVLPQGSEARGASLRISQGTDFCGRAWGSKPSGQQISVEAWLAPGDYTVTAEAGELRGTATFTVGATAGPPVRITLR